MSTLSTALLNTLNGTSATSSASSSSSSSGSSSSSSSTGTSSLGKDDFLQLLVAQLNNQNPLDPQDNTAFVAQLAQFSTVESLENLNTSVSSILSNYSSTQALQAASLVGRSVVAEASTAQVDTSQTFSGSLSLPSASSSVEVGVYDSAGNKVKTISLGKQSSGTVDFSWDGSDDSGNALSSGNYTFKATADIDGTATALTTYLPSTISSVTMGQNGSDMTLNLAGGTSVALSKVETIGQ